MSGYQLIGKRLINPTIEGVELMQNVICKSCGKPMLSKFQKGGQASGSELTSNIGYWHCEGCDVYVFHAEYVAGKSKLFHKLLQTSIESLKKFNR